MPRKRNRRKEAQAAKRAAEPNPKRVLMIDPAHHVGSSSALAAAVAAAFPSMVRVEKLDLKTEGQGDGVSRP